MPDPEELTAHLIALADSDPASLRSVLANPDLAKRLQKIDAHSPAQAAATSSGQQKAPPQMFRLVLQLWPIIASCCALGTLVIAWLVYGVSPMHAWEELAHRQAEYERETQERAYRKNLVQMHLDSGDVFLGTRKLAAAKVEFQRALLLSAESIEAELGLLTSEVFESAAGDSVDPEVVEQRLGLIVKGIEMQSNVEANQRKKGHVLMLSGDLYHSSDPERAEEAYRNAIAANPEMAHAYFALGELIENKFFDQGEPRYIEEAMSLYEKSLNLSPWNVIARNNVARVQAIAKTPDATKQFETLTKVSPDYMLPYCSLARLYLSSGSLAQATESYDVLLRMLDDDLVRNLPLNQDAWVVTFGSIELKNWEDKRCYVLLSAALSQCLIDAGDRASALIAKAAALPVSASRLESTIQGQLGELNLPDDDSRISDFRNRWEKGMQQAPR